MRAISTALATGFVFLASCGNSTDFSTVWNTANVSEASSDEYSVRLPLLADGVYDFSVDWGDGTSNRIIRFDDGATLHRYAKPGLYRVSIMGQLKGWRFAHTGDKEKLVEIRAWGPFNPGNAGSSFAGCVNLTVSATDAPDLDGVSTFREMFEFCTSLTQIPGIENWKTGNITDMTLMFDMGTDYGPITADLSSWDTSNVTNMAVMFYGAESFNSNLSRWDTSNVTTMEHMFCGAVSFTGNVSTWDTGNVTDMSGMFSGAIAFDGDLSAWKVSNVADMSSMFEEARAFSGGLNTWDTSSVRDMSFMFAGAGAFNGDVSGWNTAAVRNMAGMFSGAASFAGDLAAWNTGSVTSTMYMFRGASAFNGDISSWNTSRIASMVEMFKNAVSFDRNLGAWDLAGLGREDPKYTAQGMLDNSGLSIRTYDATLIGWAEQKMSPGVELGAKGLIYSGQGEAARRALVSKGWKLVGDGPSL